jgi:hypothetical protein
MRERLWSVSEERVAVDVEGACFVLAGRAEERVDRWADFDFGEACLFEHLLPARTGQPAGDSPGPEVDVP